MLNDFFFVSIMSKTDEQAEIFLRIKFPVIKE
jgi:hypothetical protein